MRTICFCYPEGKRKALTMSYDDGQIFDRELVSIFNEYKIKATFHLNSGNFGKKQFVSAPEIKELYKGHEVSVHTVTHPFLTQIPKEEVIKEIIDDRKNLETLVGYPVRGMSYPFGDYNDDLVKMLPSLGIEYSRTVVSTHGFGLPSDFLTWHPTCHHNENILGKLQSFKKTPPWEQLTLFYVWGHSFEFDRDKNWDMIREFCKRVAFDDSVWYATNIEIMDYIKALRNLKFSTDRNIVQNLSSIDVWISVDRQPVKIKAGEIVYL
ncbi:polysaccharide deacetylase [Thermoclostridium stercorarium subsp. stercorarium DSM 8532]|uniref:Polysaccharide deacetylase n=2 Tax=Thermoclostridium stercorarium TaxID=1510 RepID=L7VIF6_THES1|nr:polysaccharide deacetylase family protein [Thermoclostridium stercorarium]AGC67840.1 polysaccharide deacetylase [Thermoclostridium stercorarium subsp. stercorarium DSM 8532]AGI38880.1 deacetylase [Thermoclostridium stercorarium subsp. stercorarium DSM 8532]ANW98249.1 polysaccharide deacetylase [Thermoclostridium stercorarium subsp. thermolacticum DSM 2910]